MVRKLLFGLAVVAFAACASSAVASAGTANAAPQYAVAGWAFLAPDTPLEAATVRLLTPGGVELDRTTGITGERGTFFVYSKRPLPQRFLIEVTGGRANGLPFGERLLHLVTRHTHFKVEHVDPLTTFAAAYAFAHPALPVKKATSRVKQYLRIPADSTLGESMRLSNKDFDGVEFMRQAAHAGGLKPFMQVLIREIDGAHARHRQFVRTTHSEIFAPAVATADPAPSFGVKLGTGVLTGIATGVAKAVIGKLLTMAGAGKVSDFLGLTDNGQQQTLSDIQNELTAISTQLTQIDTALTTLQTTVQAEQALLSAQLSQSTFDLISNGTDGAFPNVTVLGTTSDDIKIDLETLAAMQQDVVTAIGTNTASVTDANGPADFFCTYQFPPLPANASSTVAIQRLLSKANYKSACATLTADLNVAPPAGTTLKNWCNGNGASPPTQGTAVILCDLLTLTKPYGTKNANDTASALNSLLNPPAPADSIVSNWAKVTYDTAAAAKQFLNAANFSTPMNTFAQLWATRLELTGFYGSLYDAMKTPTITGDCKDSNGVTLLRYQCDVSDANGWGDSLAALALAAIPTDTTVDPTDGREWFLAQQGQTSSCVSTATDYDAGDGNILWGYSAIAPASAGTDCAQQFTNLSLSNGTSTDTGWTIPSSSDLTTLFGSNTADAADWMASNMNMPDATDRRTAATPTSNAEEASYILGQFQYVCNSCYAHTDSSGTENGVWTSECFSAGWLMGYTITSTYHSDWFDEEEQDLTNNLYYYVGKMSDQNQRITGTYCHVFDFGNGQIMSECITATPECNTPVLVNGLPIGCKVLSGCAKTYVQSDGEIDFGHDNMLLVYRQPPAGEYTYGN